MITDAELEAALSTYADALTATIDAPAADVDLDRQAPSPWYQRGSGRAAAAAILAFVLIVAALVVVGRHDSPPAGTPGWTKLPAAPLGHREESTAVWTGKEWLVFGGMNPSVDSLPETHAVTPETTVAGPRGASSPTTSLPDPVAYDGAAFDPTTQTWSRIPRPPLAGRRAIPVATSGPTLTVLAGDLGAGECASSVLTPTTPSGPGGATYDPESKTWSLLPTIPYVFTCGPGGAWIDSTLYVTGPVQGGYQTAFASYDPATRQWTQRPAPPVSGVQLVGSGGRIYVFGAAEINESLKPNGEVPDQPNISPARIASFDPTSGSWTVLPSPPINAQQLIDVAGRPVAWDGSKGAVLDVATGTWRTLPVSPVARRDSAAVVAVGSQLVVWGGSEIANGYTPGPSTFSPITKLLDDGASYDFATNSWTTLADSPLSGRFGIGAAGSGDSLFVWGGATTDHSDIPPADDGAILRFG